MARASQGELCWADGAVSPYDFVVYELPYASLLYVADGTVTCSSGVSKLQTGREFTSMVETPDEPVRDVVGEVDLGS